MLATPELLLMVSIDEGVVESDVVEPVVVGVFTLLDVEGEL